MTPLEVIGTDPDLLNALCRFFFDHLVKFLRVLRTIQYRSDEASTTINPFVCQPFDFSPGQTCASDIAACLTSHPGCDLP